MKASSPSEVTVRMAAPAAPTPVPNALLVSASELPWT